MLRDGYTFACRNLLIKALDADGGDDGRRRARKRMLSLLSTSTIEQRLVSSLLTQFHVAFDAAVVVIRIGSFLERELMTSKVAKRALTTRQLQAIYSGSVTDWADVFNGLRFAQHADAITIAERQIQSFRPASPSGVLNLFRERIMDVGEKTSVFSTSSAHREYSDVPQLVQKMPTAGVAFMSFREYMANTDNFVAVPIAVSSGRNSHSVPVGATSATISSGEYQPLTRNLYVVARNEDLGRFTSLQKFFGFTFGTLGQNLLQNFPGVAVLSEAGVVEQRRRATGGSGSEDVDGQTPAASSTTFSVDASTTATTRLVRELTSGVDSCPCRTDSPLQGTEHHVDGTVRAFVRASNYGDESSTSFVTRAVPAPSGDGSSVLARGAIESLPEAYGLDCRAWDLGQPYCAPQNVGSDEPPASGSSWVRSGGGWIHSWCENRFCWVNFFDCVAVSSATTQFFSWAEASPGVITFTPSGVERTEQSARYSYATCGTADTFTTGSRRCIETIHIGGSSTVLPIVKLWAKQLEDKFVDRYCVVVLATNAAGETLGSGDGARGVCSGGQGEGGLDGGTTSSTAQTEPEQDFDIGTMSADWDTDDSLATRLYDGYSLECCQTSTESPSGGGGARTTASITSSRNARCRNNRPAIRVTQFEIGFNAIAVFVRNGGVAHQCLDRMFGKAISVAQLRWIFSNLSDEDLARDGVDVAPVTGTFGNKQWSHLHPSCAAEPIEILGPSSAHGSHMEFKKRIFPRANEGESFASHYTGRDNVDHIIAEVSFTRFLPKSSSSHLHASPPPPIRIRVTHLYTYLLRISVVAVNHRVCGDASEMCERCAEDVQ